MAANIFFKQQIVSVYICRPPLIFSGQPIFLFVNAATGLNNIYFPKIYPTVRPNIQPVYVKLLHGFIFLRSFIGMKSLKLRHSAIISTTKKSGGKLQIIFLSAFNNPILIPFLAPH
jgi:hypothetical protein